MSPWYWLGHNILNCVSQGSQVSKVSGTAKNRATSLAVHLQFPTLFKPKLYDPGIFLPHLPAPFSAFNFLPHKYLHTQIIHTNQAKAFSSKAQRLDGVDGERGRDLLLRYLAAATRSQG